MDWIGAPEKSGLPIKEIPLETTDEETVYAWLLEHPEPRGEVLFFHGNGGNLSIWQDFLMNLYHHSLTVFTLDYRGYGKSTGSPTEEGLYKDAEALLRRFWTKIHRPDLKVIYWGQSLGGSVAAFATTVTKPDGVILESSFPNKYSLLNHHPVLKVLGFLSEFKFPTAEFLDGISRPVLVLHGEQDKVVPSQTGAAVIRPAADGKIPSTPCPLATMIFTRFDPDKYWEHINQLIDAMGDGQDSH